MTPQPSRSRQIQRSFSTASAQSDEKSHVRPYLTPKHARSWQKLSPLSRSKTTTQGSTSSRPPKGTVNSSRYGSALPLDDPFLDAAETSQARHWNPVSFASNLRADTSDLSPQGDAKLSKRMLQGNSPTSRKNTGLLKKREYRRRSCSMNDSIIVSRSTAQVNCGENASFQYAQNHPQLEHEKHLSEHRTPSLRAKENFKPLLSLQSHEEEGKLSPYLRGRPHFPSIKDRPSKSIMPQINPRDESLGLQRQTMNSNEENRQSDSSVSSEIIHVIPQTDLKSPNTPEAQQMYAQRPAVQKRRKMPLNFFESSLSTFGTVSPLGSQLRMMRPNAQMERIFREAGLESNSHITTIKVDDDDTDWETEVSAGELQQLRQENDLHQAEIGSSLADVSDSETILRRSEASSGRARRVPQVDYFRAWNESHNFPGQVFYQYDTSEI